MSILVAIATGILEIAGKVVLTLGLAAFSILYATIGLVLTPVVWAAVELPRLPRRLLAPARLARQRLPLRRVMRAIFRRPSPEG